ncbi:LptF/LptG family permease [Bacteroidales bacterium OttesenSCG-928-K03]|nr:LptF/LptG family permease [Odoribacter sp. OttesenSCG-928-L07]MDL2243135.1 LptF/LptG family permease [Bacteroidales bacterium OttesenSCG-928-K03]
MIKRFDIYLLKSFVGPLIVTFIIGDFILLMQFFWVYVDELVGKGLEWYIIAELMFYAALTFVPMALPIGVLLSSLMVFGNLGERYELVALKSAGVSLWRILTPLIFFIVGLSMFSFYFCNDILPKSHLKFDSIFYDIRRKKMAFNLTEGVFYNDIEGYVIRANKKDKDDKTLYEVMVYKHKDNRGINDNVTFAEKGVMEVAEDGANLVLTLYDGYNYDDSNNKDNKEKMPFQRVEFEKEILVFDLSQFDLSRSDEDMRRNHYRSFNFDQLNKEIVRLTGAEEYSLGVFVDERNNRYMSMNLVDTIKYPNDYSNLCDYKMPLLDNYNLAEQQKIVRNALDHARNVKSTQAFKRTNYTYTVYQLNQHKVEFHRRCALAFACVVMFFVGAPLGAIIRKGGLGLPLVLSVAIFVLYYIILTSGQKAVLQAQLNPFLGVWLANIIVMPFGIFLTTKATSDAPLLDRDAWLKSFNKFFNLFKKNKDRNK